MAVLIEYSVVNTVSLLGDSAKLPIKAKLTDPLGTISGLSPATRGIKYDVINGINTGTVFILFWLDNCLILDSGTPR